jgi:hypothetical protein
VRLLDFEAVVVEDSFEVVARARLAAFEVGKGGAVRADCGLLRELVHACEEEGETRPLPLVPEGGMAAWRGREGARGEGGRLESWEIGSMRGGSDEDEGARARERPRVMRARSRMQPARATHARACSPAGDARA